MYKLYVQFQMTLSNVFTSGVYFVASLDRGSAKSLKGGMKKHGTSPALFIIKKECLLCLI